jgi:hypothetical protein
MRRLQDGSAQRLLCTAPMRHILAYIWHVPLRIYQEAMRLAQTNHIA